MLLWLLACADPALLPCDDLVERLEGLVVDMDGNPIPGATVRTGWSEVTTDDQGRFFTAEVPGYRWVEVLKEGYVPRARPAIPGDPVRVRLHEEREGHVQLVFAGDVMAGRRFLTDDTGNGPLVDSAQASDDLWKLLEPISPLFSFADYRSVNLEGPLIAEGEPNPDQDNPWANPVELAQVLSRTGINLINLGNNHIADYLGPGIVSTLQRANNAGLIAIGAGANFSAAWAGHRDFLEGNPVAFIACNISYLESEQNQTDATDTNPGVASCTVDDLRTAIISARQETDFIVVQIHGGVGYTEEPSYSMEQMALTAGEAGAAVVIGHGPHVLQGFEQTEGAFVSWSLGNLLFDQNLWSTLSSGVLQLDVEAETGSIHRATFEPLLIQNYSPVGIRGPVQDNIARELAARSGFPSVVDDGSLEIDLRGTSILSQSQERFEHQGGWSEPLDLEGDWINSPEVGGRARVGRDLLLGAGAFEDVEATSGCASTPLWNLDDPRSEAHSDAANQGSFGIRSEVSRYSVEDATSRPQHRIPIDRERSITLSGWIRGTGPGVAEIRFYSDTSSSSIATHRVSIETQEDWSRFQIDTFVPEEANYMLPFVGAEATGSRGQVDIDELKLIAWSPDLSTQLRRYDHLQVEGSLSYVRNRRIWPGSKGL
ncbi:MAG: CapA family protein [Myxococcota bacterium]|nr:CapA family protein [Myxococcota bacterium]